MLDDQKVSRQRTSDVSAMLVGPTSNGCGEPSMAQLPHWSGPQVTHGPLFGQPSVEVDQVAPPLAVTSTLTSPRLDPGG
jgi:hypothetical protein